MTRNSQYWIEKLQLNRHPEGGYFREVYRSGEIIHKKNLPERYSGYRNLSTSIYFLLEGHDFSAFHRLKSDEIWHFYDGSAIVVLVILPNGLLKTIELGKDFESGQVHQAMIPKGYWFSAHVKDTDSYSLVGCTVAPGFDFDDFEIGEKDDLFQLFPQHYKIIDKFSR